MDTSIWSLVLRRAGPIDHVQARRFKNLLENDEGIALTGSILQEVLQAFRREETVVEVTGYLQPFPLLEIDRATYVRAAGIHRRCAAKGITASTVDCQIAAAAVRHQHVLLTADADFGRIATVCELELL